MAESATGRGLQAVRQGGCRGGRCAEEFCERGDGFEQQRVGVGLLAGVPAGAELGDRPAVLGLSGELAHPGSGCGVGEGRGVVSPG